MAVPKEFQKQVREKIKAARDDGGETLDLSWIKHSDAEATAWVVEQIQSLLPQLTTLKLQFNQIGEAGAVAIAKGLPRLTTLQLWNNQIGDTGAVAIAQGQPQLTWLDMRHNQIGEAGAVAIAEGLSHLTALLLAVNQIGDVGAVAIAKELPQLTTLELGNNQIGDAGVVAIARAIQQGHWPQLTELWLDENGLSIDQAVLDSLDPQQIADAILGNEILPAARIMFLGMGEVGKTRLAKRCFEHEFTIPGAPHDRTEDFNLVDPTQCQFIPQITLRGRPQKITPYVWDFGGQPELHGLHEAFLGDRPSDDDDDDESRMGFPARPSPVVDAHASEEIAERRKALTPGPSPGGRGVQEGRGTGIPARPLLGRSVYVLVLAADKVPGTDIANPNLWDEKGNGLPYWLKMLHHHAGPDAPVVIAITRCDTPYGKLPLGERAVDQPVDLVVRDVGGPFQAVLLTESVVVTTLPLEEFRRFGVNVIAVVDGLSATEGEKPAEQKRLMAANGRLEEAITAALRVIEKPLAASVPPKIVQLIKAVEPELRPLPYLNFNHFQQLCVAGGLGEANDRPGVLPPLQQSSLRILDGLGVLFFFGKTDRERRMHEEQNERYRKAMAPGREHFERKDRDSQLRHLILNPRWIKSAAYQIAYASKGKIEFRREELEEYVQKANALITGQQDSLVDLGDSELVQEFMKLSGLCWEVNGTFHFPRGYQAKELPRIDDWPLAILRWRFLPETAFFRYVVDLHSNPLYDLRDIEQRRHAVKFDLEGITLAVTAQVASDTLEIRFDPQSNRDEWKARVKTIRDEFCKLARGTPWVNLSGLGVSEIVAPLPPPPSVTPWERLGEQIHDSLHSDMARNFWEPLWTRWKVDFPHGPEPEPKLRAKFRGWTKYTLIINNVWRAEGATPNQVQKLKGEFLKELGVILKAIGRSPLDVQVKSGGKSFKPEEYRLVLSMDCCKAVPQPSDTK